jgi:hypothetical protein
VITLLLSNWKLVLLGVLVLALGIQSYRLQGAQGEVQVLTVEARARQERDALRELQNLKNKERTDEEHLAARRRASTSVVRVDGPGIRPFQPKQPTPGSDQAISCVTGRQLDEAVAGIAQRASERLAGVLRRDGERRTGDAREAEGVAADFRACKAWAVGVN